MHWDTVITATRRQAPRQRGRGGLPLAVCSAAAGLLACVSTLALPRFTATDAELDALKGDRRARLQAAQSALGQAGRERALQTDLHRAADREMEIAEQQIKRCEAVLEIARLRFEAAQEARSSDETVTAKDGHAAAGQQLAQARAALRYWEAATKYRAALVDEAEAREVAARARLQLTAFEEVSGLRGETGAKFEENRAKFRAYVSSTDVDVSVAHADVARTQGLMERARATLEGQGGEIGPLEADPADAAEPETGQPQKAASSPTSWLSSPGGLGRSRARPMAAAHGAGLPTVEIFTSSEYSAG